jgi:hypothetical protein
MSLTAIQSLLRCFERLQCIRIVWIQIDDGLPGGDATGSVGLELGDLDAESLLVVGVRGEASGLAENFDERHRVVARSTIDARELVERIAIVLVGVDDLAPRFDGTRPISGAFAELRDLGIGGSFLRELLRNLAALTKCIGQSGPFSALAKELDQWIESHERVRLELERRAIRRDRVLVLPKTLAEDPAEEDEEPDLDVRGSLARVLRVNDRIDAPRGFAPLAETLGETLGLAESLRRRRVDREPTQRCVERAGPIVELAFGELDEALQDGRLVERILDDVELCLEDRDQARGVAILLEQRLEDLDDLGCEVGVLREQALESDARLRIVGHELQHLAIRRDRLLRRRQRCLVQVTEAEQVVRLLHIVIRDVGLATQHVREIGPAIRARQDALQRAQCGLRLGTLRGATECQRCTIEIGELLLGDVAQAHRIRLLDVRR